MVAQVVPNGAQSGSKGAQRLPKWRKNAVQGLQNVCPKLAEKREAATKAWVKENKEKEEAEENEEDMELPTGI